MYLTIKHFLIILLLFTNFAYAQGNLHEAVTQPIAINELTNYENYSPIVKQLITQAQTLTEKNLTYLYGSNDPSRGGMDCSGTIYYLLSHTNLKNVPRDSSEIYKWVWQNGKFYAVTSDNFNSFEFSKLKPGDLLFWTGTYNIKRDPPITHVMLYLGKNKQGQPLMFGASDGRTYQNKQMWGVSVFDFKLPNTYSASRFVGYGCIPNLTCE